MPLAAAGRADRIADSRAHRVARQQLVDEPVVDRDLCRVAARVREQRRGAVGVALQRSGGSLRARRDVGLIRAPERARYSELDSLSCGDMLSRVIGSTNDLYSPTVQTL